MTPETLAKVREFTVKQSQQPAEAAAQTSVNVLDAAKQQDALQQLMRLGVAGVGMGAAGRGAMGLYRIISRRFGKQPQLSVPAPVELTVPYPGRERLATKRKQKSASIGGLLRGEGAASRSEIPWFAPAALLTGVGSVAGGWKGMDMLLDSQRKARQRDELERAKKDYEEALLSQYDQKSAAERTPGEQLGDALDELFDSLEKNADWTQQLLGGYGLYATGSGLAAALAAYQMAKKRNDAELLRKAQQQRLRSRYEAQPAPVYAHPLVPQSAGPSASQPMLGAETADDVDESSLLTA